MSPSCRISVSGLRVNLCQRRRDYFFSDIFLEISAMSLGRRSASTLSTMPAMSDGFSDAGAGVSCAVCSAPAATAIAAASGNGYGFFGFLAGRFRCRLGFTGVANLTPTCPGGCGALHGFFRFFVIVFAFAILIFALLGVRSRSEGGKGVARRYCFVTARFGFGGGLRFFWSTVGKISDRSLHDGRDQVGDGLATGGSGLGHWRTIGMCGLCMCGFG